MEPVFEAQGYSWLKRVFGGRAASHNQRHGLFLSFRQGEEEEEEEGKRAERARVHPLGESSGSVS